MSEQTMSELFLLITVLALANQIHGKTDPTLTCIGDNGSESPPPCQGNENSVLFVRVTITQEGADEYAVQGLYTDDISTLTNQAHGRATAGKDYMVLNSHLPFVTTASAPIDYMIQVTISDDTEIEETEEFIINANFISSSDGSTTACSTCNFVIQILDDDGDRLPTITLDQSFYTVLEGDELVVGITRGTDGQSTALVGLLANEKSATSEDFTLESNPTMLPVDSGDTATLKIPTSADGVNENGMEVFEITILERDAYIIGANPKASVFILDLVEETPTYWLEYSEYRSGEGQTPFTFYIKRSVIGFEATIFYFTRHVSTSNADFEPVSDRAVTFNSNSDTAEGSVEIISDKSTEDPEIFEISIANPSIGALGSRTTATVTLYDALSSQSKFKFTSIVYTTDESSAGLDINLCREGDLSQEGSVVIRSSDIGASESSDYTAIDRRITFAANEDTKTERVGITPDTEVETLEFFQLTLTEPSGGVLSTPGSAIAVIRDDDYCYSFATTYYIAAESSVALNLDIAKKGYLEDTSTTANFIATGGSATPNDYSPVATTFSFPRGMTLISSQAFVLEEDAEYEDQEEFTVELTDDDPGRICEPSTATIAISKSESQCTIPCENNGICVAQDVCMCTGGFGGPSCEDICDPPCENGGECVNGVCDCLADFSGLQCQIVTSDTGGNVVVGVFSIDLVDGAPAVFSDELNVDGSPEQMELNARLIPILRSAYGIADDESIEITGYTAGSIMVEYKVVQMPGTDMDANALDDVGAAFVQAASASGLTVDATTMFAQELCPAGYCANGGTCIADSINLVSSCSCTSNYQGDRCQDTSGESGLSVGAIAGIEVAAVMSIIVTLSIVLLYVRRRRNKRAPGVPTLDSLDLAPYPYTVPRRLALGQDQQVF